MSLATLDAELRNTLTHPRLVLQLAAEGRASRKDLKRAVDYIDEAIRRIEGVIQRSKAIQQREL